MPDSDSSATQSENATQADPAADPRCNFDAPPAALVAARYADYRATRNRDGVDQSPGDLTETATLADGTRVRVVSYGCVDSFGHDFSFTYDHTQHAAKETAFWTGQARMTLAGLALNGQVLGADELRDWLTHAARLKLRGGKIVQCRDKTQPPDNECAWRTGGSFSLAIEPHGDAIEVTLGVDYSG